MRPIADNPPRVLHVDDEECLDLVAAYLNRLGKFRIRSVSTAADALDVLDEETVDCVLSDYEMPSMDGIALLGRVRERRPDIPFVLYTGQGSERVASEALSAGLSEYMQKGRGRDHYQLLARRIRTHVQKYRTERRVEQVDEAIDAVDQGFSILDEDGQFVHVNDAYASLFGYPKDALLGESWRVLYRDEDVETVQAAVVDTARSAGNWRGRTRGVRRDGEPILYDHQLQFTSDGLMVCLVDDPAPATGDEPVVRPE